MDGGYTGRLLEIDLTGSEASIESYPDDAAERFLGGFGANNRLFSDYSTPDIDPLSSENPVVLGAGPFVGTIVPGSSRVMANSRVPLTGAVASASGSMGLGAHMKWSGLDHIVILGKASRPTYVVIEDDQVQFRDAGPLWGKKMLKATRGLWNAHPGSSVLTIGPSGENLVSLSLAMIDAAATLGRGGLGAVLGAKNLKALVIKGSGAVSIADPGRLRKTVKGLFKRLEGYSMRDAALEFGMIGAWPMFVQKLLPSGTADEALEEAAERFGPNAYLSLKKSRIACPSCFLADKDELCIPGRDDSIYSTSFLNAAIIGAGFLMRDAVEAVEVLALLDDLGLDFFTLSNQANSLLDMAEDGFIDERDVEGIPLSRSGHLIRELAVRITTRSGKVGEALANGWAGLFEHFGKEAERYAMLVRNQDCLYDPRVTGMGTMEFEQVVSPRGPTSASSGSPTYLPDQPPDRIRRLTERMGAGPEAIERIFSHPHGLNVGRLTRYSEDWFSLFSSLGLCNRHQINRFYSPELIKDLLSSVTGRDLGINEIMERTAEAFELYRELSAGEGLGVSRDEFPEAWFNERQVWGRSGHLKDYFGNGLERKDAEALLEDYYDERARKPG